MTATAAQIAKVRRMTAEPTDTTYDDDSITTYIEDHPLFDANGEDPTYLDHSTKPPTVTDNDDWIATYDLNAAAADIWEEKAAGVATYKDFSADGASVSCSQIYDQYKKQARYYRSRASAQTVTLHKWPKETEVLDDDLSS